MKRLLRITFWVCLLLAGGRTYAQQSGNVVDFLVTYDVSTTRYTAWAVPQYNVPNNNNAGNAELGGTAQFSIKVPSSFSVVDIQDVHGFWDKTPLRLGPGNAGQNWTGSGLDPAVNYYIIGKSPSESNYGAFATGTPVALFTFRGNGCFGPISPLDPGDVFIAQADQRFSLNVANSFYSRSAQPSGGNQNPLEQFRTVSGSPAQCAALAANSDTQTLTTGTSVTLSVLANDIDNGQPVSTTNVTVTIASPPASGTAVLNANGTVAYTPAPGFTGPVSFTYTICDVAQPTLCSSAVVSLTVQPTAVQSADLLITKQASQSVTATGGVVSFTVTVVNRGPGNAVGVVVTDTLVRNKLVQLQGTAIPSKGTFDVATGIWAVGGLTVNETVTLVLSASVLAEGVIVNVASVTATGSQDLSPNNNEASACTSVPYTLCTGESLAVSVPSTYQAVQWFRNGSSTPIATGNSTIITQAGTYTVSSLNGVCPIGGCCPIIVQAGVCCLTAKCVPFTIKKTKSHL